MKMNTRHALATLLVAGALAGPLPALAHQGGTAGGGCWAGGMPGLETMPGQGMMQGQSMMQGQDMMGGSGQGMMQGQGMSGQGGFVEGRIAFLQAELGITEAQQPLFDAVAAAMRNRAAHMGRGMMADGSPPATLPERLERMEEMMALRLSDMQSMRAAVDALYDAMSDEQRAMADRLMCMM